MSIVRTLDGEDFADAFRAFGRVTQFTPSALRVLFEHLEEISDEEGVPMEMDVIGICGDFTEMGQEELWAIEEAREYAEYQALDPEDKDSLNEAVGEWARYQGALECNGGLTYVFHEADLA